MTKATGTFEIEMTPADSELEGRINRFNFTKTFRGELTATGAGVFLSAGDPTAGDAGYVAVETVDGRLHEREGGFALQQYGAMNSGEQALHYAIIPGSGQGELAGITGIFTLTVDDDGTHHYQIDYAI